MPFPRQTSGRYSSGLERAFHSSLRLSKQEVLTVQQRYHIRSGYLPLCSPRIRRLLTSQGRRTSTRQSHLRCCKIEGFPGIREGRSQAILAAMHLCCGAHEFLQLLLVSLNYCAEVVYMLKSDFLIVTVMVHRICTLLVSQATFLQHQAVYLMFSVTDMQNAKGFTSHDATIATIIGNCGAIVGGFVTGESQVYLQGSYRLAHPSIVKGYISQFTGRRLTIILCCLWTGCFIPLWLVPSSFGGLAAGAFFVQTGVQGAWG